MSAGYNSANNRKEACAMNAKTMIQDSAAVRVKDKTQEYLRSKNLKADWERILRKADRERPNRGQPVPEV